MIPYRKRALEERYRVHWGRLEMRRALPFWLNHVLAILSISCVAGIILVWL